MTGVQTCALPILQVNSREQHSSKFLFPLNHYHGLTIGFDIAEAEDSLLHVMEGFSVDIKKLRHKFCPDDHSFIMRAGAQISHIFSEALQRESGHLAETA